jgi:hypothetical protein
MNKLVMAVALLVSLAVPAEANPRRGAQAFGCIRPNRLC